MGEAARKAAAVLRGVVVASLAGCSWTSTSPTGARFGFGAEELTVAAPAAAAAPTEVSGAGESAPGTDPGGPEWLRGGAGGPEPYNGPGTQGLVLAEGVRGARPVPGAWVVTPGGHRLLADAEGRFLVPEGAPLTGRWVVGARAHVTSVVEGYEPEATPTLHLEPFAREVAAPEEGASRLATLSGTVVDAAGQPVSGAVVTLAGAGVVAALPVLTDAAGAFRMTPRLSTRGAPAASLVAVGGGRLGVSRQALSGQDQAVGPVVAAATTHALEVQVAPVAELAAPVVTVTLRSDEGVALSLPREGGRFRLAELPGVRYDLTAEARAADGTAYSRLERPALAIDWGKPASTVEAALLPPPALAATPLSLGGLVRWAAVPGASGYTLSVAGPVATPGWPWEGFTTGTELAVALPGGRLPSGDYRLGVTAWDAPGLGVRTLAAVEGVRALRRVDRARGVREAHRSKVVRL